ncbi:response regulator transcription factor [Streptomyces sp. NPDC056296]|uniref:response regulator transcription factor n=1 Tax=Streptomyces sp. NPDC056296 TaxID=3345775 RepID=UPI0035DED607
MNAEYPTARHITVVLQDVVQRYGIEAMVRTVADGDSVRCFATGEDVVARLPDAPDLVLLAAKEAGEQWPEYAEKLRSLGTRLLVLVDGGDDQDIERAAKIHGQGFVDQQDLNTQTLSAAVTDVLEGRLFVSSTLARTLLGRAGQRRSMDQDFRGTTLTPRELEVLQLLAEGLSNKQVARRLVISEHGVKRLVSNILAKLNCPNRTMAVVRAMQEGLLAPEPA